MELTTRQKALLRFALDFMKNNLEYVLDSPTLDGFIPPPTEEELETLKQKLGSADLARRPTLTPLEEIEAMNEQTLEDKRLFWENYFDGCRRGQHGISTKEMAWYGRICERLEAEFGQTIQRWR